MASSTGFSLVTVVVHLTGTIIVVPNRMPSLVSDSQPLLECSEPQPPCCRRHLQMDL